MLSAKCDPFCVSLNELKQYTCSVFWAGLVFVVGW